MGNLLECCLILTETVQTVETISNKQNIEPVENDLTKPLNRPNRNDLL